MVSKSVGRSVKLPFDQLVMFSTASAVPLVPHLQELDKFLDLFSLGIKISLDSVKGLVKFPGVKMCLTQPTGTLSFCCSCNICSSCFC